MEADLGTTPGERQVIKVPVAAPSTHPAGSEMFVSPSEAAMVVTHRENNALSANPHLPLAMKAAVSYIHSHSKGFEEAMKQLAITAVPIAQVS